MRYTFSHPGHSLWSLGQSNLWNPDATAPPSGLHGNSGPHIGGGLIFFGGGVPLYKNGKIIGGVGISGGNSRAEHQNAKRDRNILGMDPPRGATVDDNVYNPPRSPFAFSHPRRVKTLRNSTL